MRRIVTDDRANEARGLPYLDPKRILTESGALRTAVTEWPLRFGRKLSENERKRLAEEIVQAAAFCWGMGELWKRHVEFSPKAAGSHDCVLALGQSAGGDPPGFLLLQLKGLPPQSLNPEVTLQSLINDLDGKYHDPDELYLGIAVNRSGEIDFSVLKVPEALRSQFLELWIFGRTNEDRAKWFFRGDLLAEPLTSLHSIPDILPFE